MKIFYILFLSIGTLVNAQFTKVLDFSNANVPSSWFRMDEHNIYDGKAFYTRAIIPNALVLDVTDGTIEGTKTILNIPHETLGANAQIFTFKKAGNGIYFVVKSKNNGSNLFTEELWFSDGTSENTKKLLGNTAVHIDGKSFDLHTDFRQYQPSHIGNTFYFWKSSGTEYNPHYLWSSDGTVEGTHPVAGAASVHVTLPVGLLTENTDFGVVMNGNYYFIGRDASTTGYVDTLYKLNNGIPEPIIKLSEIHSIGRVFKGKLYFDADYIKNGYQTTDYFVSDGTPNGTKVFNVSSDDIVTQASDMYSYRIAGEYMFLKKVKSGKNQLYITKGSESDIVKLPSELLTTRLYADDKKAFFINATSEFDFPKSYSLDLESLSVQEMSVPFYADYGFVYKGALWIANKKNYRDTVLNVWRSGGDDSTTALVPNSFSHLSQFFALNNELYAFSNYLNFLNLSLYKFNDDYTFTNASGDNKWETPNNWKTKITPLHYDDAVIPEKSSPIIAGETFVNNLNLNSPLNISSGNLNIYGALNLENKINITDGSITLRGNNSKIQNGSDVKYIATEDKGSVKIESLGGSRGVLTIPIGTQNFYNPISISNTGTTDNFSIGVKEGIENTTNGAVNATWNISEETVGGSNVTLSLGWNANQHNNLFNPQKAKVGHYIDGAWKEESSSAITGNNPYTISASGITSFSPFSVMNFESLSSLENQRNSYSIYPSPFETMFIVDVDEAADFKLYNFSGRQVYQSSLVYGKNQIQASGLNSGVYLYVIKNKKTGLETRGKILKK